MNSRLFKIMFCACLLFRLQSAAGQTPDPVHEALFSRIEARLDQQGGDTVLHFIFQQVRNHCGTDNNCQYKAYHYIMIKLERRFNLPLAISVGEEMVKTTQRQGNLSEEAKTYRNLSRYHGALGNNRLTIVNLEKALRLFEQLGDQSAVIRTKMALLENSLGYRKIVDALPEMEALLAQVVESKDTASMNSFHIRLMQHTRDAKLYDKMEEHVEALEKVPLSNPFKPAEYGIAINAVLGRANLLVARGKPAEAEGYYQKALRLCEAEPNRWLEIHVLQSLSDLEWERGNAPLAKSYLDKAQGKAEKLELQDLLANNYERKAAIAEAEGRFADALEYIKKQQLHDNKFEARSAGFNVQSYFLQQEKEQLATEKKNQELELRIRKTQLWGTLATVALLLLIAAMLFIGLHKQRKGKQALAAQNALIQQQAEQLKTLDVAKTRFFANISHELRTPLTLLLSPINTLLKENKLTEKQTELLHIANQGSKRLQLLVNEILDLGKLESGKMKLVEEPVNLGVFFKRCFAQFESLGFQKGIAFGHSTLVADHMTVMLDKEKCRQIIYNLLSNAFKFTQSGGSVHAVVKMENDELLLAVSDTGKGIHADDLPHIFDRYYQTNNPDAPAMGGTGIGLALCQEYAHLFGGSIKVESVFGQGSKFEIRFPAEVVENQVSEESLSNELAFGFNEVMEKPDQLDAPATTVIPEISGEGLPTILVAEDNVELQAYMRLVLQNRYRVFLAENGQHALDYIAAKGHPDLIISDLMMPVMDGYQLLERLKGDDATRHIPAIMLTARAGKDDRLKALRIGVDDYLTKPFDEEELLARIANLLANQSVRKEMKREEAQTMDAPILSKQDEEWLENFETYVKDHLASDILTISFLAQEFAMSESTLLRQVTRLTGLSPKQYLQEVRLTKALQLMEDRTYSSISNVATEVGYATIQSFSKSFKQRFGKSPSEMVSS